MGEKEKGKGRDKGREVRGGKERGEGRRWNGREERASHIAAALGLAKPRAGPGPPSGSEWAGYPPRTPTLRASGCSPSGLAPPLDPKNILNRLTCRLW